jgi:hypothetical protein
MTCPLIFFAKVCWFCVVTTHYQHLKFNLIKRCSIYLARFSSPRISKMFTETHKRVLKPTHAVFVCHRYHHFPVLLPPGLPQFHRSAPARLPSTSSSSMPLLCTSSPPHHLLRHHDRHLHFLFRHRTVRTPSPSSSPLCNSPPPPFIPTCD